MQRPGRRERKTARWCSSNLSAHPISFCGLSSSPSVSAPDAAPASTPPWGTARPADIHEATLAIAAKRPTPAPEWHQYHQRLLAARRFCVTLS